MVKKARSGAEGLVMDLGTATVSALAAAAALLPRIPALTSDGRRRARILGDTELWKAMPESDARDELAEQIAIQTRGLVAERTRDKLFEQALLQGTAWAFGGWVLLQVSRAIPQDTVLLAGVRELLGWIGLVGLAIGLVWLLAVAWVGAVRAVRWIRPFMHRIAGKGVLATGEATEDEPG